MMKRYLNLLFIGLFLPISIIAQVETEYEDTYSVAARRFPGGTLGLRKYLGQNARYPESAAMDKIVGVSLSSCSISPKGKIENIKIINPLSKEIDAEVCRMLKLTGGKWKKIKHDSIETFHFCLVFILNPIDFSYDTIVAKDLLKPIAVAAYAYIKPDESAFNFSDDYIAETIVRSIKSKEYQSTLEHLDEAIRRNPFNPKLYQIRIMVNSKLEDNIQVQNDISKLQSFINGKPLESLIR